MLDGVVGFVERDGARPKFLRAMREAENGVGECVVECLPDIEVDDISGLLLTVFLSVVNLLILLEIGQLLGHFCVPHFHHISEFLEVVQPLLLLLQLKGTIKAQSV